MTVEVQLRDRSRDKALLIAIEYKWPKFDGVPELHTSHKDLERVREHLIDHWNYLPEHITIQKDGECDEATIPTRDNILREIDNLVEGIKADDRRVFFFAGHCYQIKNRRGTETDGLDEAILTARHCGPPHPEIDYDSKADVRKGIIIDNDLRERLVNRIPCGAKLVAIADTCHSGTLFDLNWHWHCDSRDGTRLLTIPSFHSTGARPVPPRRLMKCGGPQEYVYRAEVQSGKGPAAVGQGQLKKLFSRDNAAFFPHPESIEVLEWDLGEILVCASPTQEPEAEVLSLSSAEDHQQAWSRCREDTMTSLLVEVLEELGTQRVSTKELTHRLNRKMRKARRQTMEAFYRGKTHSRTNTAEYLQQIDSIQIPQVVIVELRFHVTELVP